MFPREHMKPISRTSLLLSVGSPAQNTRKDALLVPTKPRESSVLDASVDLTTKTGSTLKSVIEDVVEQLPEAPSVIFKPGSEDAPVPIMRVEGVRLRSGRVRPPCAVPGSPAGPRGPGTQPTPRHRCRGE